MRAEAGLWLRRTLGVGLLLGLWQLAALFFPPLVVPPIPQVAATLAELIREPDFWPTVGTTLLRLVTGLGIGIAAGAVLGLLFGLYPAGWCWLWSGSASTDGPASSSWQQPRFPRWSST